MVADEVGSDELGPGDVHDGGPDAEIIEFDDLVAALLDEEWIPLAVAEELAGVSRSTLRAWYRSGRIASRMTPGPHGLQRMVSRTAVLEQAARSPRTGGGRDAQERAADRGADRDDEGDRVLPTSDTVRLAELAIAEARERAERAEARAADAEAALRAALERAAAAEVELRVLRDR